MHIDVNSDDPVELYERLGYERVGVIEEYPRSHSKIHYVKRLGEHAPLPSVAP